MVFLSIKCRICRYFLIQLLVCKMSWNLSLKFCFSGVGHYSAGTAGRYRKEKEGGRLLGGRKWPRLRGLCKKIAFWALSLLLSKYKAMVISQIRESKYIFVSPLFVCTSVCLLCTAKPVNLGG